MEVFHLMGTVTVDWSGAEKSLTVLSQRLAALSDTLEGTGQRISWVTEEVLHLTDAANQATGQVEEWNTRLLTGVDDGLGAVLQRIQAGSEEISAVFSRLWSGMVDTVTRSLEEMNSSVAAGQSLLYTLVQQGWERILSLTEGGGKEVLDVVTDSMGQVRTEITAGMEGSLTQVGAVLDKVREKFADVMEKVKDTVSAAVEQVKSLFNFTWSLPSIKLPHFSIKPSGWSIGDLLKGSIPSLSISWYAKSMDDGMIMNSPTIFGVNGGQLMAGGEAGSETVVGTESLMDMIARAAGQEQVTEVLEEGFRQILALLGTWLPQAAEKQIYLDGRTLVGELAPDMNVALGKLVAAKG